MKKLLSLIVLLLVAILMVLTRPTLEEHKAAMLDVIGDFAEEETRQSLGINLFGRVGRDVMSKTIGLLLDTQLKEHNYYLFNTTSIEYQDKDQLLSVGIFGHVFTFDKEMLREKLPPELKGASRE